MHAPPPGVSQHAPTHPRPSRIAIQVNVYPLSWDVFPNAVSVAIQYLSLDWPFDNGWVAYNSLQVSAYFVTVFIAGPLAILTGLGMSPALSTRFRRISSVLSIQTARSLHFLVLVWFLLFIVMHVTLVLSLIHI